MIDQGKKGSKLRLIRAIFVIISEGDSVRSVGRVVVRRDSLLLRIDYTLARKGTSEIEAVSNLLPDYMKVNIAPIELSSSKNKKKSRAGRWIEQTLSRYYGSGILETRAKSTPYMKEAFSDRPHEPAIDGDYERRTENGSVVGVFLDWKWVNEIAVVLRYKVFESKADAMRAGIKLLRWVVEEHAKGRTIVSWDESTNAAEKLNFEILPFISRVESSGAQRDSSEDKSPS